MILLSIVAVCILLCNMYALIAIILGIRKMRSLAEVKVRITPPMPMVSVIVPACNEEITIEPALRSLLTLDYNNIEIIVVNDRSTDNTAGVLQKLQKEYPELQILTISALPDGWLGKNNALQQGALKAKGEYLLFTDADIVFGPSTLSRAISLVLNEQIHHLSLIFKNIAGGSLLNSMMVDAGGGLFFLFKPWRVHERESKYFMGVGAFNLIKKTSYTEIGGHKSIKMHPIDDIMLGKVVKQHGFRQECLTAYDYLQVHWYDTTGQMIHGLMKNIFALYNFKITYVMTAVVAIFVLTILPLWGVFISTGIIRIICFLCVCLRLTSTAYGARVTDTTYKTVAYSLVTPYINIYIIVTGMIKTITGKGIEWRGTFYPLEKLKGNDSIL